ncbi:MAG: hypothetical protein K2Q06_03120 [Parvularculaceae bacterium]|nr:hypothetical protein [Parvularculaceae bacterium]
MTRVFVTLVKRVSDAVVEIRRADGSISSFPFPNKGPIPHDYVHFVVEDALGMKRGFWGLVADGVDPQAIAGMASAAGHASAKRARQPDASIVELLQAERIVECFEADLWSGPTDSDVFRSVVVAACGASHVSAPVLKDDLIESIRTRIIDFAKRWRAAPLGARFEVVWNG